MQRYYKNAEWILQNMYTTCLQGDVIFKIIKEKGGEWSAEIQGGCDSLLLCLEVAKSDHDIIASNSRVIGVISFLEWMNECFWLW